MGFSRQEYWSGLPFPSPGDLADPAIEPGSLALQTDFLPSEPPWGFNHNQDLTKFCFQLFELIYPPFCLYYSVLRSTLALLYHLKIWNSIKK